MDVALNNAIDNAIDTALLPFRIATSKPARRAYISITLAFIAASILLGFAIIAYILFYNSYIPSIHLSVPIHFQFPPAVLPISSPSQYWPRAPFGLAHLPTDGLIPGQSYDVTLSLNLPRSPPNLGAGNFMLDLSLLSPTFSAAAGVFAPPPAEKDILAHSRRPAILTYTSPLVDTAVKLVGLPWLVLGWKREAEKIEVPMFEDVVFGKGWRNIPGLVRVELLQQPEGKAKLEVYSLTVGFTARFGGIRWWMWNHRIISAMVGIGLFWSAECVSAGLAWLVLARFLSSPPPTKQTKMEKSEGKKIKREPGTRSDDEDSKTTPSVHNDLSDTPRTFPTYSRQPPLRYISPRESPAAGGEEEDTLESEELPVPAGEAADDEEEYEYEGLGVEGGPTDSGIGTSLSEAGRGGMMRRRGRGRARTLG